MASDDRAKAQRAAASAATFSAACMIAQQVGGKATRDALFLASFGPAALATVMFVSALLSLGSVVVMSRTISRVGPARAVPIAFILSGALFAAEGPLSLLYPRVIAAALYLHVAIFGGITVSGFWSVVNERFDPHEAKAFIGRITGGAALGGVIGGLLAERCASLVGVRATLPALAGVSLLCAAGVARVSGPPPAGKAQGGGVMAGLRLLDELPYLRHMAALVAMTGASATLADYAFKAEVAAWLTEGSRLVAFFAVFHATTNLLTFAFQAGLSKRSLEVIGLGGTLAVLHAAVLLTGAIGAAVTRVGTAVVVRAAQGSLGNSLFRSGYELLYTPLAQEKKRPTKAIIDVAFDRLGDAGGSGLVLLVLAVAPAAGATGALGLAAALSAGALWVCYRLHGEYVAALAEGLRSGAVRLADEDVVDATTRSTLSTTTLALDREHLLEQIRRLPDTGDLALEAAPRARPAAPGSPAPVPRPPLAVVPPTGSAARVLATAADLLSDDPERIASALAQPLDPRVVAHALPSLARADVRPAATEALRRVAPRVVGQLADALLDPEVPAAISARIPRILEVCDAPRAVAALLEALRDPRFTVRSRAAEALSRIRERRPEIALPEDEIAAAVARELGAGDGAPGDPARTLEHVFALLALVHDREPLELSLRALVQDDDALRGTALEYLDNVLPASIRRGLQPYIDHLPSPPEPAAPRTRQELVAELRRSLG